MASLALASTTSRAKVDGNAHGGDGGHVRERAVARGRRGVTHDGLAVVVLVVVAEPALGIERVRHVLLEVRGVAG